MGKKPGSLFRVRLTVIVTIVAPIVFVAACLLAAYLCFPSRRVEIAFVTVLTGGGATVYAAYYAGAALRLTLDQKRQHATFEILAKMDDIEAVKIRRTIEKQIDEEHLSREQICEKIEGDEDLNCSVRAFLGRLEDTSLSVQFGHVDEWLLYRSLGYVVPKFFNTLRAYVQRERGKDRSLYIELEKLVAAWHENVSLYTGKKFPH